MGRSARESRCPRLPDDTRGEDERHRGIQSIDRVLWRDGLGAETQLAWAVLVRCGERLAEHGLR